MNQSQVLKNISGMSFKTLAEQLTEMGIKISGSALGMRANRDDKHFKDKELDIIKAALNNPTPEIEDLVTNIKDAAMLCDLLLQNKDVDLDDEDLTFEEDDNNDEFEDIEIDEHDDDFGPVATGDEDTLEIDEEDDFDIELDSDIDAELSLEDEDELSLDEDEDNLDLEANAKIDELEIDEDDLDLDEEDDISLDDIESEETDLLNLDDDDDIDINDLGSGETSAPTFSDLLEDDDDEPFENF